MNLESSTDLHGPPLRRTLTPTQPSGARPEGDRACSIAKEAWAEPAVVSAFGDYWDRELHGLLMPTWRKGVVRILEYAAQRAPNGKLRVADFGCAAGVYARHLLQTKIPFEYHGYDHNPHILRETRRRWEFLPNDEVTFHELDVRKVPWPIAESSVDVALWDSTLRFCEQIESPISESARICRGLIVLARTPFEARTYVERRHYYGMSTPSTYWHFERQTLEKCAAENGLVLTPGVGTDDTHVLSREPLPAVESLRPSLDLTKRFHEAFVVERMRRVGQEHAGEIVIFGAGQHSRWLWIVLPEEIRARVTLFVDDAARDGDRIGRCDVRRPNELSDRHPAVVVVSSDSQEETLAARAHQVFGARVPVVRLYEFLPPGPYDKATVSL